MRVFVCYAHSHTLSLHRSTCSSPEPCFFLSALSVLQVKRQLALMRRAVVVTGGGVQGRGEALAEMVEKGVADVYAELAAVRAQLAQLQGQPEPGASARVSAAQLPAKASGPQQAVKGQAAVPEPTAQQCVGGHQGIPAGAHGQQMHTQQQLLGTGSTLHAHGQHLHQQHQGTSGRLKHRPPPVSTDHHPFSFQSVASSLPTPTVQADALHHSDVPSAATTTLSTVVGTSQPPHITLEQQGMPVGVAGVGPGESVGQRMAASAAAWALLDSSSSDDEGGNTKDAEMQDSAHMQHQVQHMALPVRTTRHQQSVASSAVAHRGYSSHAGQVEHVSASGRGVDAAYNRHGMHKSHAGVAQMQQHADATAATVDNNYPSPPPARRQRWTVSEIAEHTSPRQLLRQGLGTQQEVGPASAGHTSP
jgi:hypothetical protein